MDSLIKFGGTHLEKLIDTIARRIGKLYEPATFGSYDSELN